MTGPNACTEPRSVSHSQTICGPIPAPTIGLRATRLRFSQVFYRLNIKCYGEAANRCFQSLETTIPAAFTALYLDTGPHMEGTFRRICTAAQRSVPQPRPRRSGAQWALPAAYAVTSSATAASAPSHCGIRVLIRVLAGFANRCGRQRAEPVRHEGPIKYK